ATGPVVAARRREGPGTETRKGRGSATAHSVVRQPRRPSRLEADGWQTGPSRHGWLRTAPGTGHGRRARTPRRAGPGTPGDSRGGKGRTAATGPNTASG